jgi:hypothetical protein
VTTDGNASAHTEARVIALRPRARGKPPDVEAIIGAARGTAPPLADLAKFEQPPGHDDYRHRMLVNAAALAFILVLTAIGIWIAVSMAAIRTNQDCVLMGRKSCAPVEVPPNPRLTR